MAVILRMLVAGAIAATFTALVVNSSFAQPLNGPGNDFTPQYVAQRDGQDGNFRDRIRERRGERNGERGGERSGEGREKMREKMMSELGITPEQQAELKASKAKGETLHKQVQEKRRALMEYMASPEATENQALSKSRELANLQQQLGDLRIKTWFEIKGKLTPEQEAKMREMRKQMHEKMKNKMGEFQNRGGGEGGQRPGGRQHHRQEGDGPPPHDMF